MVEPIKLHHFRPSEFREWWDDMDPSLLVRLDVLRGVIGEPIVISPVAGALGRRKGPDAETQHNIDRWGQVRAVDVMIESMRDRGTVGKYVRWATRVGFTGIGVYPDWKPHPGLHLDTRRGVPYEHPATWGMVRDTPDSPQRMVSMDFAIDKFPA